MIFLKKDSRTEAPRHSASAFPSLFILLTGSLLRYSIYFHNYSLFHAHHSNWPSVQQCSDPAVSQLLYSLEKLTNLYFATSHLSHMLVRSSREQTNSWIRHPSLAQSAMGTPKIMWCKWYSLPLPQQRLRAWLGIGSSGLQPEYVIHHIQEKSRGTVWKVLFICLWRTRLEPWQCKLDRNRVRYVAVRLTNFMTGTGGNSGRVSREKVWSSVWQSPLLWLLSSLWYFPFPEREKDKGKGGFLVVLWWMGRMGHVNFAMLAGNPNKDCWSLGTGVWAIQVWEPPRKWLNMVGPASTWHLRRKVD